MTSVSLTLVVMVAVGMIAMALVNLRLRSGWWFGAILVVAVPFVAIAGALLLDMLTAGKARPVETMPWLTLGSVLLASVVCIRHKRSSSPSAQKADDTVTSTQPTAAQHATVQTRAATSPALTLFLSYRRADSQHVSGRIYDRLIAHFGAEHVFKDVDDIPLGIDFREFIGDRVARCDALLAVIGADWVDARNEAGRRLDDPRDLVRAEVAAALVRDIPVIPVLVSGANMPVDDQLPEELRDLAFRNGIPVRPDPDFHNDVSRLIKGLEANQANQ